MDGGGGSFYQEGFLMLILKRKLDEKITIDTNDGQIVIQVTQILAAGEGMHRSVKLGIDAPRLCKILREEVIPK